MSQQLPAIIKLGTVEKARGVLGIMPDLGRISLAPDANSARLPLGYITFLAGSTKAPKKKPGQEAMVAITHTTTLPQTTVVEAGDSVLLHVPALDYSPKRYRYLVSANPELFRYGAVSSPGCIPRLDLSSAFLGFTAHTKVDLETLQWCFDVMAIE